MYDLSLYRYRELKNFCLQYNEMKARIAEMEGKEVEQIFDPTSKVAVTRKELQHAVKLIEMTAFDLGNFPGETIFEIVTGDKTIGQVCPENKILCEYYLRKFYWMLSRRKGI